MILGLVGLSWWFSGLYLILVWLGLCGLLLALLLGVMIVLFASVWVGSLVVCVVLIVLLDFHGCVYFNLFMICYFCLFCSWCILFVLVVWLSC